MSTADNAPQPIGRAAYKGRDYAVLWKGPTQYGDRVKLAFPEDLDETFWVDAAKVEAIETFRSETNDRLPQRPRPSRPRRRPTDDGPRRRPEPPEQDDSPAVAEECYCASCGQLLPQQF